MFDEVHLAVTVRDLFGGQLLFSNQQVASITGRLVELLQAGPDWWSLVHPDDHALLRSALRRLMRDHSPQTCSYRIHHAAGHYVAVTEVLQRALSDDDARGGAAVIVTVLRTAATGTQAVAAEGLLDDAPPRLAAEPAQESGYSGGPDGVVTAIDPAVDGAVGSAPERYQRHDARFLTDAAALNDDYSSITARFRALFETSNDGIFIADAETGILLDVNFAGARLVGRPAEELIGHRQQILHRQGDATCCEDDLSQMAREAGVLTDDNAFVVRPDGTEVPVAITTATFRYNDRNVIQVVFRDATAQREQVGALRGTVEQLSGALSNAPIGVCLVDLEGRIQRPNLALATLVGVPAEKLVDAPATDLVVEADAERLQADIRSLYSGGNADFSASARLKGSKAAVQLYGRRFADSARRVGGAIILVQDLRQIEAARAEAAYQRRRMTDSLVEMAAALATTIEQRDPYACGHQSRVARIAVAIAEKLGLSAEQTRGIDVGARLHDIGMIGVPAEFLIFPGDLSELQKALIREHPRIGCQIIRDIETPWPIAEIIAQHHERLDGSGYPEGLSGDQICLEARIVGVADVLEALTAHRPHRPALGLAVAVARLKHGRGTIYDSDVVDACLALTDHPVKCQALLGRSS